MNISTLYFSAFLLGATHAVEPGHGKSFIVAALVDSKQRWLDPIRMGIATALGHTLGVFIFSQLSFYLAHTLLEGRLRFLFEGGIGVLLILLGIRAIYKMTTVLSSPGCSKSCCHSDEHSHVHRMPSRQKSFFKVSFLIGLIPCPTAIALATTSVGMDSGIQVFILAGIFGCGVATTLATVGLLVTHASGVLLSAKPVALNIRWLRFVEPAILILLGFWLMTHVVFGHEEHTPWAEPGSKEEVLLT